MIIRALNNDEKLWETVTECAANCSWNVGKFLANRMKNHEFTDWESVFVALDDDDIAGDTVEGDTVAGYCSLTKNDCIPDVPYTPYLGFLFVDERYRGQRLSEKLIDCVIEYTKEIGFPTLYLVTEHVNLYEKYGFNKIVEKTAPWDPKLLLSIYSHAT